MRFGHCAGRAGDRRREEHDAAAVGVTLALQFGPVLLMMPIAGLIADRVNRRRMLFVTQTTVSVPALMGAIMCIGVATSNSILMITFANDQRHEGHDARSAALSAGVTRLRPAFFEL